MKRVFCLFLSMVILTVGLAYLRESEDLATIPISDVYVSENKITYVTDDSVGAYTASEQTVSIQEGSDIAISQKAYILNESGDLTADGRETLKGQQADSYAFSKLTENEQDIYIEILWALQGFNEDVKLSAIDKDEISLVFQCVLNDHPEIFYVDGYTYTQYTLGDVIKKITFTGTYNMDADSVEVCQKQIDDYVNQCLGGLASGSDEYETVKYIYEYLINHTEYNNSSVNNQNICSVFIEGQSVCQGYAKATQYLLQRVGIKSELVLGEVSTGEGHAWNLVNIDKDWYYVDTTWGDASYQAVGKGGKNSQDKIPTINYDYLCVTTEQLSKTHTIDNVVELPQCVSVDANYYVREGLYLSSVDEEQLTAIFKDGYDKGRTYVTLKCASLEIYDKLHELLIKNQEIFHYLNCPDGVVSYTENAEQYSMSFWL